MTTGSIPTFISVASSFTAGSVKEDNWLSRLSVSFTGDDTWTTLYPTSFVYSAPYPSFNTRDINTVDDGVKENYVKVINTGDVSVFHTLGVDHVGHTYGPSGVEMSSKLHDTDILVNDIIKAGTERGDREGGCEVGIIFGDHGMTKGGNHGGGTKDEVEAGLYVWVKDGCGFRENMGGNFEGNGIRQISVVSAITDLMGRTGIYGNLGGGWTWGDERRAR